MTKIMKKMPAVLLAGFMAVIVAFAVGMATVPEVYADDGYETPEIATWSGFRKGAASFTFEDGAPSHVSDAGPMFDKYGYKASFYLVVNWNPDWSGFGNMAKNGHEIGSHSTTHPQMSRLSRGKILQELTTVADHIEALTGARPTLFRAPYGDYSNDVVLTARGAGYEVIQWSVDSLDWKNRGAEDLIRRATRNVKSGDIVLFHNDAKYILDALPAILKSYREQGLTPVPVSQLLLPGNTTIDAQGRQRPAPTTVPEV